MPITSRIEFDLGHSGMWTNVSDDVFGPVTFSYGIQGDGPNDRVARAGSLRLAMRNGAYNVAGLEGRYSPDHGNKRDGFEVGIRVRVVLTVAGRQLVKWIGTIDDINPESGPGRRLSHVTCVDWMDEAATRKIGGLALREDVRADELFSDVLAAMPKQPEAIEINGQGQEIYRFGFDTAPKDRIAALTELQRIAASDAAYIYQKGGEIVTPVAITSSSVADPSEILTDDPHLLTTGDSVLIAGHTSVTPDINGTHVVTVTGASTFTIPVNVTDGGVGGTMTRQTAVGGTLVYEGRTTRAKKTTNVATFTDTELHLLDVGRSRRSLLNTFHVTAHPRKEGDTDTVVLYESTQPIDIPPNGSRTLSVTYRDPGTPTRIGATDQQTPQAGTDYVANSAADGSGTDHTGSLDVDVDFEAAGATITLTNPLGLPLWATTLQLRGRPIYDFQRVQMDVEDPDSIDLHGQRDASVDMPYQDDVAVAEEYAQYLLFVWKNPLSRVPRAGTRIGWNDAQSLAVLLREPGDRIGIQEQVTGIRTTTSHPATVRGFYVQSVSMTIHPGAQHLVDVEFGLTRADHTQFWLLGVPGSSELDQTTRLGFGLVVGHTDLAHADAHADSSHSDVAHSDVTHQDMAHGDDSHGDVAHADSPHVDFSHSDIGHDDQGHADAAHGDSHGDAGHSDVAHGDQAHVDEQHLDQESIPKIEHFDVPHVDSHADTPHSDGHADVPHDDQPHSDVAHSDQGHIDASHSDITHSDQGHVDAGHEDVAHEDVSHGDASHGDTHDDVPHGDGN